MRAGFNDLNPLTGLAKLPFFWSEGREECRQLGQSILAGAHRFFDQVTGKWPLRGCHIQQVSQVIPANTAHEVKRTACFQEFGGKTGERAEEQGRFAIDVAGIQVGHRHRRRAYRGLTVDLGIVPRRQSLVFAGQPDPGNREAAVTPGFGHPGFLKQGQAGATGPYEYKTGIDDGGLAGFQIFQAYQPASVNALESLNFRVGLDLKLGPVLQMIAKVTGERAKVYVAAVTDSCRRHGLLGGMALTSN